MEVVIFSTLADVEKMKMAVFYLLMDLIGINVHQIDMFSSFL